MYLTRQTQLEERVGEIAREVLKVSGEAVLMMRNIESTKNSPYSARHTKRERNDRHSRTRFSIPSAQHQSEIRPAYFGSRS